MIAVFFTGILFTIFTLWITVSMFKDEDGYIECIKNSYEDDPFLTVMFFIMQITGILMLYFGFVTPSSNISRVIDNKDGTLTSIEYSLSGDSVVKNNIKAPVEIYGVIINIEHKNRLIGKMFCEYTEVTYNLNDGRIIKEEYNDYKEDKDIKIGNAIKAIETFYPSHNIKFSY